MPDHGNGAASPGVAIPDDLSPPPDVPWGGYRSWVTATAAVGLALVVAGLLLPRHQAQLPWFLPAISLVMCAGYAVVAALALLDASCRHHSRSLAIAVAAVALAGLAVPRALTFPGVVPGTIPGVRPNTSSLLAEVILLAAPALLTIALVREGGALARPGRAVLAAVALGLGIAAVLTALAAGLAPLLPLTTGTQGYTAFSRVLGILAFGPTLLAVALFLRGFRGDRRVAPSVGGALTLLLVAELMGPLVGARFQPLWYVSNLLFTSPAAVLLVGQLGLYRASVRTERERAMETAALYAATRAMTAANADTALASIPRIASAALGAVCGGDELYCTLVEFEGDRGRIVAAHDPAAVVPIGGAFPISEHPPLAAVLRERRTITRDLSGLGPEAERLVRHAGGRRGAYAPVLVGDQIVGALTLGLRTRRDFSPAELRLLDGLATTASLALTTSRVEAVRQLQYEVARALSVAETVDEAATAVLAHLSATLDCQVANLWLRDRHAERLVRSHTWHSPGIDVSDFLAECDALGVRRGRGLPGRVWATAEPEVVTDVDRRAGVVRARTVSALGVRGAIAVPIVIDGACTGVVEVLTRRPRPSGSEVLGILVDIGRQLGQFIGRKRAEGALRESAERLTEIATTDRLTGLKNRREFEKILGVVPATPFAVLAIDVDGLKQLNDDHGHEAGDVLIQAVAMTLRSLVRSWDIVARVGGDEFAVILPGVGGAKANTIAERMRTAMHSITIPHGHARISVGWAAAPAGADPSATWRAADEVLYRAKRGGRDRVEGTEARDAAGAWSTDPGTARDAALLTEVFARGTVDVVYQPIVDLRDRRIVGYEALARPAGIGPEASVAGLFDAARRLGRIRDLDWLCRRAALREAATLPPGATLFLNVSAAAFLDPVHEVDQLLLLLRWAGRSPEDLVLELTEQESIADLERLQQIAGAHREHGVRFAADDVGDGHSTLEVLAALDPEYIKVARSLSTSASRPGSRAAIRAAQAFASDSGATLIAEGVETPEVARELLELGIGLGQGNHLGPPAPAPSQRTAGSAVTG